MQKGLGNYRLLVCQTRGLTHTHAAWDLATKKHCILVAAPEKVKHFCDGWMQQVDWLADAEKVHVKPRSRNRRYVNYLLYT